MSSIEFLVLNTNLAKQYRLQAALSIGRNAHLTNLSSKTPSQAEIDAVLVDFINYVGTVNGVDYALNVNDLRS
jgi:hypothetical protein